MLGPIHRTDINGRIAVELLQSVPGQPDNLIGGDGCLQAKRLGRSIHAHCVEIEIGCHTFKPARAVEYR